jgi:predicted CoA-binding protein
MKLEKIKSFLDCKNIAVAGVSSTGKGFGVSVFKHLRDRNYNVFPININGGNLEGEKLNTSIKSISEKLDGIVTVVPPAETEKIVIEANELGIKKIWMQQGSESKKAIEYCKENGMDFVHGECIMMFSEPVKSIHKFHRGLNKLFGKYPK